MAKIARIAALAFFVLITGLLGMVIYLDHWAKSSIQLGESEKKLYLPRNTKLVELAGVLESAGIIDSAKKYYLWVKIFSDYPKFQAGNYKFSGPINPDAITKQIISGEVFFDVFATIAIPEGFTLEKILDRLAAAKFASKDVLKKLAYDQDFLNELQIEGSSLEGYIYPATYTYYKRPSPKELLKSLVKKFDGEVDEELRSQLKQKGLTLQQATTFASLIELETMHDDEKPKIAEVIWNRLNQNQSLGIDASVIYGVQNYKGNLTKAHLLDKSNAYNTRIHKGLPPGPIGSPAKSSFTAILNPTNKGYYFYVLLLDGNKRHHFSKNLAEHNKYVKLLLKSR